MPRPSILLIPFLLSATLSADDETSFSTAPDSSWERVEPLKEIGLDLANFDFSNQSCRITCAVPPAEVLTQLGAAAAPRANLLAPTEFVDSVASVDVTFWQVPLPGLLDGSFPGVFTRIQPDAGFGQTTGFALTLQTLQNGLGRIRIYLSYNEALLQLGQSGTFTLDPSRAYRLVLASRGDRHVGRIFDLTSPGLPVATVTVQNPNLVTEGGRCGFGVAMPHPLPIDITFDNFLAWDGTPPPLAIRNGIAPGTIELLSDTRRSMGALIETTIDLGNPASPWTPATPISSNTEGNDLVRTFSAGGTRAFFRGRSL